MQARELGCLVDGRRYVHMYICMYVRTCKQACLAVTKLTMCKGHPCPCRVATQALDMIAAIKKEISDKKCELSDFGWAWPCANTHQPVLFVLVQL